MTMRRTIGLSLALLVISAAALGKTPDKGTSDEPPQPPAAKLQKSEDKIGQASSECDMTRTCSSADRSGRTRYRSSPNTSEGTPDSYLDPVRPSGPSQTGKAAWYGLVGNYTASGE